MSNCCDDISIHLYYENFDIDSDDVIILNAQVDDGNKIAAYKENREDDWYLLII